MLNGEAWREGGRDRDGETESESGRQKDRETEGENYYDQLILLPDTSTPTVSSSPKYGANLQRAERIQISRVVKCNMSQAWWQYKGCG